MHRFLLSLVLVLPCLSGCGTVAETGRSQLLWFSEPQMRTMALKAYEEETGKYPVITKGPQAEMVQRLGRRIATASGRNYEWEFKLLDAPKIVNAFALPGGKIAVYSGLLEIAPDEDSLAAVVGHEVAHATSHHGNERMSQGAFVKLGMTATAIALHQWEDGDDTTKVAIMAAFGVGTKLGTLSYSRLHESEADEIGLRFLIRAGYDPYAAPRLWDRMAKLNPDRAPEWLSTHPHPENRAKRMRELIPRLVAEEQRR